MPKTAQKAGVDQSAARRVDAPLITRSRAIARWVCADFAGEKLLLSDTQPCARPNDRETAIADAGVELGLRVATNSISLMTDLALRGQGVTMQTRSVSSRELPRRELVFVPLADPQLRPRKLLLVARSKAHLPGAPAALAKMLGEAMDALKRD